MSSLSLSSGPPRLSPADPDLRERDERLESLKAVVGKLAHDFNNFLVPQLGYVTLIKEDLPSDSLNAQYITMLEDSARKTEGALDTILLGMRPHRRFSPAHFNLSDLLSRLIEAWRTALPATAQIAVKTEIEPGCEFNGDSDQWANVFNHLLSNARFALATGGTLEVTLKPETLDAKKRADLGVNHPQALVITFQDDGFGMSPAILKRAFEPFFTTRTQVKVAGLGLTIVHSVVQLHGGQVQISTAEDLGTTVTIYAPILPLAQLKPSLRNVGSKSFAGRILLVDDDPLVREVLKTALQRHQADVVLAQNGEEGLYAFQKQLGNWDLIVTDLAMPLMNGLEFISAVRALDKDVPVIVISGDPSAGESFAKTFGEPRLLLIKKPFPLRAFHDVIRNYLPGRQSPI